MHGSWWVLVACGRILERSLRPWVILEGLRGSRKSSRGSWKVSLGALEGP